MSMRRAAGFTLLETLVALVVLGFMVAGLTEGVHFGLSAWGTEGRIMARHEDLDAVDRTLRLLVRQMDPGTPTDPREVSGTNSRLLFTSRLPEAAGGEIADMLLSADPAGRLVLEWTRHLHARRLAAPPPPRREVLLSGIERLELAYWRPAASGGGWEESWSEHSLPALVRIRIVSRPGQARHWPDVVTAPMRGRPQ
ncbi:MAG: prepilin-type N-terminal cleavage/methylation domain-containing protein [Acetobacteraceae bacterium]|nr:prepilin-type N-terminal cleavage/methylation domain-containing protein [Acetobacteraceae bacterium]